MAPKYRFIENRRAMEDFACVMAAYTRLKGTHSSLQIRELKQRAATVREFRARWKNAQTLPCGAQDWLCDNIEYVNQQFYSTLNAMRLLRGRVPPQLQTLMLCAIGEA